MKGVILSIAPDVQIVDITHGISSQNVEEAAFVLKRVYSYFPEGTIHVVVVDPGVGSERAALAVRTKKYTFLAPDNGVLKYVFDDHAEAEVFRVTNRAIFLERVSRTFHGRDVFAPVAAHLSRGMKVEEVGERFSEYVRGEVRKPVIESQEISGEIIYIDKFGNGITNIGEVLLVGRNVLRVQIGSTAVHGLSQTYLDVPVGSPLALIGSGGTLELSVHRGSGKERLGFRVGDPVAVVLK